MVKNVGFRSSQLTLIATVAFLVMCLIFATNLDSSRGQTTGSVAPVYNDGKPSPLESTVTSGLQPQFKAQGLPTIPPHEVTSESMLNLITSRMIDGQQTLQNYVDVTETIRKLAPANVLVFGLGGDTAFYYTANPGGACVYVEESAEWIQKVSAPSFVTVLQYSYRTKVSEFPQLANATDAQLHEQLYMKELPSHILTTPWDVVLIDAPRGYEPGLPGRAMPIYTTWHILNHIMTKESRTVFVFVHDINRRLEQDMATRFFGKWRSKRQDKMFYFSTELPARSNNTII
jgi:uncharacterized protein (TIGR01627 family)